MRKRSESFLIEDTDADCREAWAKEQRDEAIRRANERVDGHRARTLAIDADVTQASSFASEATSDETYTIEALTEESNRSYRTTQTSGASSGEPSVDHRASVKRSSEHSKRSPHPNGSGAMPATLTMTSLSNLSCTHRSPPDSHSNLEFRFWGRRQTVNQAAAI
jgi:hypothetical protein